MLIIYTDQQRWDALGANGNKEIITPRLDRLAKEGMNFDHYFVQNPVCMPSRVSFLTGQYPSSLGITHMGVPVPEETMTLPRLLKNYGYHTGNIGKLHFLPHANRDHRDVHPSYGFDHLEISDEPGCYEDAYRSWVKRNYPGEEEDISLGLPPATKIWKSLMGMEEKIKHPTRESKDAQPFPGRSEITHTAFVAEQTISYIKQHQHEPWCCIAGIYSPHSPWVAPKEFLDLYEPEGLSLTEYPQEYENERQRSGACSDGELRSVKHGYYAMISEVDYHAGRILDTLEELGLQDDTIVVFTSDHGEFLGEYLRYGKAYPGPDCISRVPLIIRWPQGISKPGQRISHLVEGVDVVPTLLESAGIPVPERLKGQSLFPLFEARPYQAKACALMEHTGWRNIRTQSHRYVLETDGKEMLFDLDKDPREYRNVADHPQYHEVLSDMRRLLALRMLEIETPKWRTWTY
ncbi:sulfatase-like hydrolase/transferase [Paenibacillus sp. F411]|uniref:sulfatase family protein n=1 Tax=Paenibacillus sp. F411 TaxID=2820239 RepID=UPI001AAF451C|nr:sulfatase-like hydrolase/transferase [Paenibacillus sp. F411]MBO2942648.1 sulfatase-like hydrolase/transferase [Paenibacillus sp. F411]